MIDDETLHREIDRETTPEESERLRRELEAHPEAQERYDRLSSLVRTLERVPAVEPPQDLVPAVMRAVRESALPSAARLGEPSWTRRFSVTAREWLGDISVGLGVSQRVLLTAGALAFAALGFFTVQGFPPVDRGTEGTAGAARRGDPTATGDSPTQDALAQEFMRSDAFLALMKDESARAALAPPEVRAALSQPALAAAFAHADPQAALANPAVQAAGAEPSVAIALANARVQAALAQPTFAAALASPRFAAALSIP